MLYGRNSLNSIGLWCFYKFLLYKRWWKSPNPKWWLWVCIAVKTTAVFMRVYISTMIIATFRRKLVEGSIFSERYFKVQFIGSLFWFSICNSFLQQPEINSLNGSIKKTRYVAIWKVTQYQLWRHTSNRYGSNTCCMVYAQFQSCSFVGTSSLETFSVFWVVLCVLSIWRMLTSFRKPSPQWVIQLPSRSDDVITWFENALRLSSI